MISRTYSLFLQLWFLITAPFHRNLITDTAPSIRHIDYDGLVNKGVRLIIFDLDDTLAHWHNVIPEKAAQKIKELHLRDDVAVAVLTNSSRTRVQKVSQALGIKDLVFVYNPIKPMTGGFKKIIEHFNEDSKHTAMVGDRIATDMWGARRAHIAHRILVQPYSKHIRDLESPFVQSMIRKVEQLLYGYYFVMLKLKRMNEKKRTKK